MEDGYLQYSRIQAFLPHDLILYLCSVNLPLLMVSVVLVLVLAIFVVGRFMVETLWMPLSELPLTFGAGEICLWCSFWWSSGGVDASLA